jgi:glucokinase
MRFGLDFGGTNLKLGVFDESGETVVFSEFPLRDMKTSGDLLDNIMKTVKEFVAGYPLTVAGLAIKGMVDTRTGMVKDDIGAGLLLAGVDLREFFSRELKVPVAIDNDARAYAWGEYRFGAGKGSRVMVCMTLGTGLGCSLVSDAKPYEGSDPLGGVLGGHLTIDRNGPECLCGSRGCLELYCSAPALTQRITERFPKFSGESALRSYFHAYDEHDKKYREVLNEFQDNLALGVVNVIHAYGPDTVVIGGGVMKSSEIILPGLIERVHKRAWTVPRGSVGIYAAKLGNKAAALGAAFHPSIRKDVAKVE